MIRSENGLSSLQARLDGIAHVLRDRRLEVPRYQRSYSWSIEEVQTFWGDLRSASLLATPDYFLGTLVVSSDLGLRRGVVIDGQQRLATTALLLAALRDEFRDAGEESRSLAFQAEYLSYMDLGEGRSLPRLALNKYDNEVFQRIALGEPVGLIGFLPSTRRLMEAYEYLKSEVHKEVEAARGEWRKKLIDWSEFLEVNARVVVLDVPSSADAFLIFETLNDRGLALSVADLLKNFLYGVAAHSIDEVEGNWDRMVGSIDASGDEQRMLDYLRHYWSSWYGATRERDLYRSFRSRIRSPELAVSMSSSLANASSNYLALLTGVPELWPGGLVRRNESETLVLLGLSQNRPLLLAAMDHFQGSELGILVRAMICWSVRGLLVGRIGGGTTEKYYCDVAMKIRAGRVRSAEQVLEALGSVVPDDEQFLAAAELTAAPPSRLTRYLLLAYENYLNGRPDPAVIDLEEYSRAGFQRVTSRSSVSQLADGVRTSWINRLGNVVLVERAPRSGTWPDWSQQPYKSSQILAEFASWGEEAVASRQSAFANAALKIWPREVGHASI